MTIDYTPNSDSRRVLRTMDDAVTEVDSIFGEVHQQIDAVRERIRRVLETAEVMPKVRDGVSSPEWFASIKPIEF